MQHAAELTRQLSAALHLQRRREGLRLLTDAEAQIAKVGPETPEAARLLLLIAQWVDIGFRDYRLLDTLLKRFPQQYRCDLSVEDYLCLRLVEAYRDFAKGELDQAIDTLDLVLRTYRDLPNSHHSALAHFWKGRAHRKKGEYEAALNHFVTARELADTDHDKTFAAIVKVQESWLLFQKGLSREAIKMLDRAESALKTTDHFIALGNIESARGRIARRSGEYGKALEYFTRAVAVYARRDPNHVNVARTLVNAAHVHRLLALQMRKRIDTKASVVRTRPRASSQSSASGAGPLTRYDQQWQQGVGALKQAQEIYSLHANFDGIGKVMLNLGHLYLDRGDIERASKEASQARQIGIEQNDQILQARAHTLEAAIENAHIEEETGEDVDLAVHANLALQHSEEALALARHTQNRPLLAGACIARGMTAANDFFQDWETARRCASEATLLIGPGETDHLLEDLASLKSKTVRASGINDTLRSWSEGLVGNKTFQQIAEEFAEIVIPKVWLREGRKVSRVASSLSVSPKKIRRILRNSGQLD